MESGNNSLEVNTKLFGRLLAMAYRYQDEGNLRQAADIYWTLVDVHRINPQVEAARAQLLQIADDHERNNARHAARSIYERLMALDN